MTAIATTAQTAAATDFGHRPKMPPGPAPPGNGRLRAGLLGAGIALVAAILASALTLAGVAVFAANTPTRAVQLDSVDVTSAVPGPTATTDVTAAVAAARSSVVAVRASSRSGVGTGSGVVITEDGLIVTNAHVVSGADRVRVELADGTTLPAKIVGAEPNADVAVLAADSTQPLQAATLAATLADGRSPIVGARSIAIGYPLGLAGGPTVSAGIVSAVDRELSTPSGPALEGLIQTDAPIAPGSSGGALTDANGTVIGITTAIAVGPQGATDIGYAIPIGAVLDITAVLELT